MLQKNFKSSRDGKVRSVLVVVNTTTIKTITKIVQGSRDGSDKKKGNKGTLLRMVRVSNDIMM